MCLAILCWLMLYFHFSSERLVVVCHTDFKLLLLVQFQLQWSLKGERISAISNIKNNGSLLALKNKQERASFPVSRSV